MSDGYSLYLLLGSYNMWICEACSEGDHEECSSYICVCCGDDDEPYAA